MRRDEIGQLLDSSFVLFSCEGAAEGVIVKKLFDAGVLRVSPERVVVDPVQYTPYTRLRKASDIAGRFFGTSYEGLGASGLLIARVVDSRAGKFTLPRAWRESAVVESFFTRPEIEMLAIHAEDAYERWLRASRRDRQLRPSEFCKGELGLARVKESAFLEEYWDVDRLVAAINAYDARRRHADEEHSLGDLLA